MCFYRKAERSLSEKGVECIRLNIIDGYSVDNPDVPNGICTGCHIELSKKANNDDYNLVPRVDNYDPQRPRDLRSSSICECRICNVAKMPGLTYQRLLKKKRGRPKFAVETLKSFKVCSHCFEHIYLGSNHSVSKCKFSTKQSLQR